MIKKILIIRFRQIGDSVLTLPLCSSLRRSFPEAEIHIVLNKGIAPLFDQHPDIDKIITFNKEDNKSFIKYISKTWEVTHSCEYDMIIDMRSTLRTLYFSLFSLHSPFRMGRIKWYTRFLLNYRTDIYSKKLETDMVTQNLSLLSPIEKQFPISYTKEFKLYFTEEEHASYRLYMEKQGINFCKPIVLVGVTTKLAKKKWNKEYMKETLQEIMNKYPDLQLIFNYAPGEEEREARSIYEELGSPSNIFIDLQANSLRQLGVLCANCSLYFGNEGGTRHIAQAMGVPSFAIFSPKSKKSRWLPKNSVQCEGISPKDILSRKQLKCLSYKQRFNLITTDTVLERIIPLIDRLY